MERPGRSNALRVTHGLDLTKCLRCQLQDNPEPRSPWRKGVWCRKCREAVKRRDKRCS
jgi:recombinational DNA repair protein (RecF pathway)